MTAKTCKRQQPLSGEQIIYAPDAVRLTYLNTDTGETTSVAVDELKCNVCRTRLIEYAKFVGGRWLAWCRACGEH